jgi:hypothetical protein
MKDVIIDPKTLPRDRRGMIRGRAMVAEYQFISRYHDGKHYGYRVTMEPDHGGGGFHVFHVDKFDSQGVRPIGKMLSFPSRVDCSDLEVSKKLR